MKFYVVWQLISMVFLTGTMTYGQETLVSQMEKVTILRINQIQLPPERFPDSSDRYHADIVLTIKNANTDRLGITDYNFILTLKAACSQDADTRVGDVLGGGMKMEMDPNSEQDFRITVLLGSDLKKVFARLRDIMNIIGDPLNDVCLNLQGKCKVGIESPRGWYFQNNMEISLRFQPKVQRQVLVE